MKNHWTFLNLEGVQTMQQSSQCSKWIFNRSRDCKYRRKACWKFRIVYYGFSVLNLNLLFRNNLKAWFAQIAHRFLFAFSVKIQNKYLIWWLEIFHRYQTSENNQCLFVNVGSKRASWFENIRIFWKNLLPCKFLCIKSPNIT